MTIERGSAGDRRGAGELSRTQMRPHGFMAVVELFMMEMVGMGGSWGGRVGLRERAYVA